MPAATVYHEVRRLLKAHVDPKVDDASLERLTLLVVGILEAEHASPARIAQALNKLGLSDAKPESIERRIRRIENDPDITAALCVHPLAQLQLCLGRPRQLLLILDPTTQDDRVVMLTAAVWYRGRALPLAWAIWPANTPLQGERFWQRVAALLDEVVPLLPVGVTVTWLADRAFGTPAFTDLIVARGWWYVVRVQDQTRYQDQQGHAVALGEWVVQPGQRRKGVGQVFKKQGWRTASAVVYWGQTHRRALCLVSNLRCGWELIALYRRRYPIEALFRHYKSAGWQWEAGQVTNFKHLQRLLVGMALATWLALLVGAQVGAEVLAQAPSGVRRTRPPEAKHSLFRLGLNRLQQALRSACDLRLPYWLTDWSAPNWLQQATWHHARAFVFHAIWLPDEDC